MNQLLIGNEIVDIGVDGTTPFFTINKWGKECSIELAFNLLNLTPSVLGSSIVAESISHKLEFRVVPPEEGFSQLGGFDLFITFKSRPPTNKISFDYNAKLVNAYLQPSLTEEVHVGDKHGKNIVGTTTPTETRSTTGRILDERPIHVVNSLAFYHSTKSKSFYTPADVLKYSGGKIGHLYSYPHAGWSISGNKIILTIDQNWLDTSTYPLVLLPYGTNFGFENAGASATSGNAGAFLAGCETCTGVAGTGASMTTCALDAGADGNEKLAVYDNASPHALIANAFVTRLINSTTKADLTQNFVSAPTFTAATYWIAFDSDTDAVQNYFDTTTGGATYDTCAYADFPPATFNMGHDWTARKFRMWVTMAAGGAIYATEYYTAANMMIG